LWKANHGLQTGGAKQGRSLAEKNPNNLEARVGFEPTDGGFADLSLRPLGYRAGVKKYSETGGSLSVALRNQEIPTLIIHAILVDEVSFAHFNAKLRA
jgi:hypothetical protein